MAATGVVGFTLFDQTRCEIANYQYRRSQPIGLAVLSLLLLIGITGLPALVIAVFIRAGFPIPPAALFLILLWLAASFIAWVAVTVRALHQLDLRFWQMRSTWVAAACCFPIVVVGVT